MRLLTVWFTANVHLSKDGCDELELIDLECLWRAGGGVERGCLVIQVGKSALTMSDFTTQGISESL